MDEQIAKLFASVKGKDENVFTGDDLHMGSMAPYGISTGQAQFDLQLGRKGGLPASKIVEFYGVQMSGKTTAALQAAAEWQKRDGLVVFIDTEMSFDPRRATELGCNASNIIKHEADSIEAIFDVLANYLGTVDVDGDGGKKSTGKLEANEFKRPVLFIVDSITGVNSINDVEKGLGDNAQPGMDAKQIKRGCKKINPLLGKLECKPTIIFINHAYKKMATNKYAKTTEAAGGLGIKFFASVRVEFANAGMIREEDERLGQKVAITIEKLKGGHLVYPKFEANLTNEHGFDKYESLKEAMVLSKFANKPKSSQTMTILPGTDNEQQFRNVDFKQWVDERGYDETYQVWRAWCVKNGVLIPWGN